MSLGCACSAGRLWPSYDTLPGVRLTVVVENRGGGGCAGAHGLAMWLEAGEQIVLVDTGPDPALLVGNAAALSLDLGRVVAVVLSHGHYDHSGGLPAVVAARGGLPLAVFMHPAATRERFSCKAGVARPIGMPEATRAALATPGVEVLHTVQPTGVVPGVWATGAIPRATPPLNEAHLTLDRAGSRPDPFDDDQAVAVDTAHGLVVLCGCAHAGVANILDRITGLRPGVHTDLLAGGLHLSGQADEETLDSVARNLAGRDIAHVAAGHCTGSAAEAALERRLGRVMRRLAGGDSFTVGPG